MQECSYPAREPGPPSGSTSCRGKIGVSVHFNSACMSKLKDYVLDACPRQTDPTWLSCTQSTLRDGAAYWQFKYHGSQRYATSLAKTNFLSYYSQIQVGRRGRTLRDTGSFDVEGADPIDMTELIAELDH